MAIAQDIRAMFSYRPSNRPKKTVTFSMNWGTVSVKQYRALMTIAARQAMEDITEMEAAPYLLAALCNWQMNETEWRDAPGDTLQAALREALKSDILKHPAPSYEGKHRKEILIGQQRITLPLTQEQYNLLPLHVTLNQTAAMKEAADDIEAFVDMVALMMQYRTTGKTDRTELEVYRLDVEGATAKEVFRAGFFLGNAQQNRTATFATQA